MFSFKLFGPTLPTHPPKQPEASKLNIETNKKYWELVDCLQKNNQFNDSSLFPYDTCMKNRDAYHIAMQEDHLRNDTNTDIPRQNSYK